MHTFANVKSLDLQLEEEEEEEAQFDFLEKCRNDFLISLFRYYYYFFNL